MQALQAQQSESVPAVMWSHWNWELSAWESRQDDFLPDISIELDIPGYESAWALSRWIQQDGLQRQEQVHRKGKGD